MAAVNPSVGRASPSARPDLPPPTSVLALPLSQDAVSASAGVMLTLVEDASETCSGGAATPLSPGRGRRLNVSHWVDVRGDIIAQSWRTVRLQQRFERKLERISVSFEVDPSVPNTVSIDVGRLCAVAVNLARILPFPHGSVGAA